MATLTFTATRSVRVTWPVRRVVEALRKNGFRVEAATESYRGSVEIHFDNQLPLDNGAQFGALAVGVRTGRFLRGSVSHGTPLGARTGHFRSLAEMRDFASNPANGRGIDRVRA